MPDDRFRVQHAGSTLLALDLDGDRDQDILVGDISCPTLFQMTNRGTPRQAVFRDFRTDFPADRPIRFPTFPATYYEDLDFDGVKDLLAAPNVFVNEGGLVDFGRSAWLYHNRGSDSVPDFSFRQPDFLQNTMVDLGEATAPALADYDADGDLDLFVGNGGVPGSDRPVATVWLFENTGTAAAPAFTLRTRDYLQLAARQLTRIRPGFADLNGDGKLDFYWVANEGRLARMRVVFNAGSRKRPFRFSPNRALTLPLPLETNDVPSLTDLDGDGDADLLVGKAGGNLEAYQNVGNGKRPDFRPENRALGGLQPDAAGRNAAPTVADLNGDGKPDLLVGNRPGKLRIYPDFTNNLIAFNEPVTNWMGTSSPPSSEARLGGLLHPATGDLDGDGQPEIILGTNAGGLIFLRNTGRK
ncbi:MAG: VCBS repeat-containing protein [Ferruginibacter sp.]|nr:VCBS repeat-containing protein [Cytophagales bacterium]